MSKKMQRNFDFQELHPEKSKRLTVLIIDDSEIIRERLSEMIFEIDGVHEVFMAESAMKGLELAQSVKPGLVVLDIKMPDVSGIDVLSDIKQIEPPPVVTILTNFPYKTYQRRCMELSADYFFDKSSEFSRVKDIVVELLNHSEPGKDEENDKGEKPEKILLVEDNDMNRDMLSRRLSRKGYTVVIAVNGLEAIELANSEQPDLILMDMSLPEMDGWECTRRLKDNSVTQRIPVIALTAHALKTDRDKAFNAGCDEYDVKPIDFPRLLGKIEGQLQGGQIS
jgi:two-component system, cell cycle response regulator DivK